MTGNLHKVLKNHNFKITSLHVHRSVQDIGLFPGSDTTRVWWKQKYHCFFKAYSIEIYHKAFWKTVPTMSFLCREGTKFLEILFPKVSVTDSSAGKMKQYSCTGCLSSYFSISEIKRVTRWCFHHLFSGQKMTTKNKEELLKWVSLTKLPATFYLKQNLTHSHPPEIIVHALCESACKDNTYGEGCPKPQKKFPLAHHFWHEH